MDYDNLTPEQKQKVNDIIQKLYPDADISVNDISVSQTPMAA